MNLILFLGSGVSRPAGMPMVDCLTDYVLDYSYWMQCESGGDYLSRGKNYWNAPVPQLQRFLQNLFEHQRRFLKKRDINHDPNYEDLYFLCSQIQHNSSVATEGFVNLIKRENITLFRAASQQGIKHGLVDFATLGRELIERVVREQLSKRPREEEGKVIGFDLLRELLRCPEIERLHIITLNHDTLLEQVLKEEGIGDYTDGFGGLDEDNLRWYEPNSFFSENQSCVRVIKLHGSINWFVFGKNIGSKGKRIDRYAIVSRGDVAKENQALDEMPHFLTGLDKELVYNSGIFADMYEAFLNALRQSNRIMMSGFGWNDRGVSLLLKNWLEHDKRNRLLLLHNNPDEIPGFQAEGMNDYGQGQILINDQWFCETELREVLPYLR